MVSTPHCHTGPTCQPVSHPWAYPQGSRQRAPCPHCQPHFCFRLQILRHLEASCGQRPPAPLPPAWPGPATTTAPDSSTDLLTAAVPPAVDQAFLQPLSPAPISPRSPVPTTVPGDIGQAETRPEQVTSLFAGMDLVACPSPRLAGPGPATEAPPTPCPGAQASQTLAQGAAGSGQSVFAFLNA